MLEWLVTLHNSGLDVWQEKALTHAAELFEEGDENGDGTLSCHELMRLMHKASSALPAL